MQRTTGGKQNPGMGGREGAAGHRRETKPWGGRKGGCSRPLEGNKTLGLEEGRVQRTTGGKQNPGVGGRERAQKAEWLKNCKG